MPNSDNLSSQVMSSLKWVTLGKISSQIIRWLITFWVIRLLSPEDYGIVVMADVLFSLLLVIISDTFSSAIIQRKTIPKQFLRTIFAAVLLVHIGFFTLQILLADKVGAYFSSPDVSAILKVNAWSFLIIAFSVIPQAVASRRLAFKEISIIQFSANSIAAVITLALAYSGYGFWSLVIGELVAITIRTIAFMRVETSFYWPRFKLNEISSELKFGGLVTVQGILFYVFLHLDVTLAGRYLSAAEVGIFALGLQFALMPQKKLLPLIKQVAFPAFSKIQQQPERIANYVLKAQKLCYLMMIPIFWGLASVADLIIPMVVGEKWSEAIIPTALILLVMPLRFSQELFNPAIRALKKMKHSIFNTLIMMVIMAVALCLGLDKGAQGLAWSWLLGFPVCYLLVVIRNCQLFKINKLRLLRVIAPSFIAGLGMLAAVYFSKQLAIENNVLDLGVQIAIGALSYGFLALLLQRSVVAEVKSLLSK